MSGLVDETGAKLPDDDFWDTDAMLLKDEDVIWLILASEIGDQAKHTALLAVLRGHVKAETERCAQIAELAHGTATARKIRTGAY